MKKLKGVCIGAGYFSLFQYDAWTRIPCVEITAFCNRNRQRAEKIKQMYGIQKHYFDYKEMLTVEKPDFVDIITPPETHLDITRFAAQLGINVICQKPLAPTYPQAKLIVEYADKAGIRFMVHENWRFQPWYREIRKLIDNKVIGNVHSMTFRSRMGDGWGNDAYLDRQPYFRDYPKLLIYENGVHFIDTYRYLAGEIREVFARLRKLNPVISGEDCGMVYFEFKNGTTGIWDASRYNESNKPNPRYTFGEFLLDGTKGSIRLYADGSITIQPLGEKETKHKYQPSKQGFGGDCVYSTQMHFVDCITNNKKFEVNGKTYLKTLQIQEAVYKSDETGMPVAIDSLNL